MTTLTGFDPFAPEATADPYPHYARLEARILGETLLRRGVHIVALDGAARIDSVILRGFSRYPVLTT
jgi:hypothetical protein